MNTRPLDVALEREDLDPEVRTMLERWRDDAQSVDDLLQKVLEEAGDDQVITP